MITCPKCGTKNNDNFNCCYNCGTSLYSDEQPEVIIPPENQAANDQSEPDSFTNESNETESTSRSDFSSTRASSHSGDEKFDDDIFNSVYSSSAYHNQNTTINTNRKKAMAYPDSNTKKKSEIKVNKIAIVLLFMFIIILVVWGTITILDKNFSGPITTTSPTPDNSTVITPSPTPDKLPALTVLSFTYTSRVDPVTKDRLYDISVYTQGSMLYIMGREYTVENEILNVTYTEREIYDYCKPDYGMTANETFTAEFEILVRKEGHFDGVYKAEIEHVSIPLVDFEFLSPSKVDETDNRTFIVYKTNTLLSFKTIAGNRVRIYINGEDMTDTEYFNKDTGVFAYMLSTGPENEKYHYTLELESDAYQTRKIDIDIKRSLDHDPDQEVVLELDKLFYDYSKNPVGNDTITIIGKYTGQKDDLIFTPISSSLSSKFELLSLNFSDDGEGVFTAVVRSKFNGFMEVIIESTSDYGIKQNICIKNISNLPGIEGAVSEAVGNYNSLVNGKNYVLGYLRANRVIVKEIIKTELGAAVIVNMAPNSDEEELALIEYCKDTINLEVGESIKVFATKSGTYQDTMPRFFAISTYN